MKRPLIFLAAMFAATAFAAPFVVSNPVDPATTHCGVTLNATPKITVPVTVTGTVKTCQYDLANLASGSHSITMTAIVEKTATNTGAESAQSPPLAFAKPAAPAVPGGLALSP